MKTILYTAAFLAICGIASAQTDGQPDQDRIQQQPPPPAQNQLERSSSNIPDPQKVSEAELEAEMRAKQKSQTARQTKTQPNSGIPPTLNDTLRPPKKKAVTPQP